MNTTSPLSAFFQKIRDDKRIHTSHISIYVFLFERLSSREAAPASSTPPSLRGGTTKQPLSSREAGPPALRAIQISRSQIMSQCKIASIATYHKCMRELHDLGYIIYNPSYHPILGSAITLVDL